MIASWNRFVSIWLKAWREARAAFWGCFFLIGLNSWLALDRMRDAVASGHAVNPTTFDVYDGSIRVWAIAYAILGAGSFLWERRLGGQAFTRILPVRELHVNLMRALCGIAFVVVLTVVPGTIANGVHKMLFPGFPIPAAPEFSIMGIALGVAGYGTAMFAGAIVSNFWAGIAFGWIFPSILAGLLSLAPWTRAASPMRILRATGGEPPAPVNWGVFAGYLVVGLLTMFLAAHVAEYRLARRFRP